MGSKRRSKIAKLNRVMLATASRAFKSAPYSRRTFLTLALLASTAHDRVKPRRGALSITRPRVTFTGTLGDGDILFSSRDITISTPLYFQMCRSSLLILFLLLMSLTKCCQGVLLVEIGSWKALSSLDPKSKIFRDVEGSE